MATQAVSPTDAELEVRDSWVPMIVIAMGQMLMSFNVADNPATSRAASRRGSELPPRHRPPWTGSAT
jgi:hypothetical protein